MSVESYNRIYAVLKEEFDKKYKDIDFYELPLEIQLNILHHAYSDCDKENTELKKQNSELQSQIKMLLSEIAFLRSGFRE